MEETLLLEALQLSAVAVVEVGMVLLQVHHIIMEHQEVQEEESPREIMVRPGPELQARVLPGVLVPPLQTAAEQVAAGQVFRATLLSTIPLAVLARLIWKVGPVGVELQLLYWGEPVFSMPVVAEALHTDKEH
jgi:hypothetical protein